MNSDERKLRILKGKLLRNKGHSERHHKKMPLKKGAPRPDGCYRCELEVEVERLEYKLGLTDTTPIKPKTRGQYKTKHA